MQLTHKIDRAVLAKGLHRDSGMRIQRNKIEAGGHDENSFLRAIGPVCNSASRIAPRRLAIAAVFVDPAPQPQLLPGPGIERRHKALAPNGFVQNAIGHDGRCFAAVDRKPGIAIALCCPPSDDGAGGMSGFQRQTILRRAKFSFVIWFKGE